MLEDSGQARVPPLGHLTDASRVLALLVVEVHVEVLGLEHFKLEVLVLHFVATEILRLGGRGRTHEKQKH